jgi:hypothetical protein
MSRRNCFNLSAAFLYKATFLATFALALVKKLLNKQYLPEVAKQVQERAHQEKQERKLRTGKRGRKMMGSREDKDKGSNHYPAAIDTTTNYLSLSTLKGDSGFEF